LPPDSVGAGGAITDGENLLPSVGLSTFSVGVAGGLVVVGATVEVEGDGALFSLLLHDDTNEAMAIRAAPPTTVAIRAPAMGEFMRFLFNGGELALAGGLR
jgi:hypothetical protein